MYVKVLMHGCPLSHSERYRSFPVRRITVPFSTSDSIEHGPTTVKRGLTTFAVQSSLAALPVVAEDTMSARGASMMSVKNEDEPFETAAAASARE